IGYDPELCRRVCLVLAHSLWQVALLAAVATLVARMGKNVAPERIYALHATVLVVGLLALPVTFFSIPSMRSPVEPLAEGAVVALPQQTPLTPVPQMPPGERLRMPEPAQLPANKAPA